MTSCFAGLSCKWLSRRNYNVDKVSPNGTYRVKVEIRVEDDDSLMGGFNEWGKVQFLKGQEVISTNEWQRKDNFESTFIDANPVIEWVGENILRMGRDPAGQGFSNELIISNDTDESIRQVGVSRGKYEQFEVFDLGPRQQVSVRSYPELNQDVSADYSLGYAGRTQSGRRFEGVLTERKPTGDEPVRLRINVKAQDLR